MPEQDLLQLTNITKIYPGVIALDDVSISFKKGEIHALMGENGAGKSTLIKVLSGAIQPDSGELLIDGNVYKQMTPQLSQQLGIGVIYQEFNLVPSISVAENVYIGNLQGTRAFVDRHKTEEKTREIFRRMRVDIDPRTPVKQLTVAYMQMVEIAKALSKDVRVLVMDEPTAPLTNSETDILFEIVETLKQQGVTIIFISHRISEVFRIADRITVMRDGRFIQVTEAKQTTRDELIKAMVGRQVSDTYPKRQTTRGEVALRVEHLSGNGVEDISFEVHKGEILGFAGLVGAGRTETMRILFGADRKDTGRVQLYGQELAINSPTEALANGIGLIPEDRKQQGVILGLPIRWNISMTILNRFSTAGFMNKRKEKVITDKLINSLGVKTPGAMQLVKNLSGGNQQKVVLAKWMAARCKVLIFDEPTRGIDVGARYEFYKLMNQLCEEGISIIMVSSDMDELLGMSDRIIVLCEGRQTGEIERAAFSQETILSMASSHAQEPI